MQIANSKLCESSKCRVYSVVNHPWWISMLFYRRGLLWLGSAVRYTRITFQKSWIRPRTLSLSNPNTLMRNPETISTLVSLKSSSPISFPCDFPTGPESHSQLPPPHHGPQSMLQPTPYYNTSFPFLITLLPVPYTLRLPVTWGSPFPRPKQSPRYLGTLRSLGAQGSPINHPCVILSQQTASDSTRQDKIYLF